jgi:hypothetical protein
MLSKGANVAIVLGIMCGQLWTVVELLIVVTCWSSHVCIETNFLLPVFGSEGHLAGPDFICVSATR